MVIIYDYKKTHTHDIMFHLKICTKYWKHWKTYVCEFSTVCFFHTKMHRGRNTRGKNWLLCKGPIVFFLFIDGKDTQDHQRHNHSSNVTPTTISTSATHTNDQDTDPKITPPDDLPREHNGCVQDHNNETHLLLLRYRGSQILPTHLLLLWYH